MKRTNRIFVGCVAAALEAGMIKRGPAAQREQVRAWLVDLLAGEGVTIALDGRGPTGRGGTRTSGGTSRERPDLPVLRRRHGRARRAVGPAGDRRPVALPGVQLDFEAVREDFDDPVPADPREER